MFGRLKQMAENARELNLNAMLQEIFNQDDIKDQLIDLNQDQLYNKGLQSDGSETGQYALKTIKNKLAYGDARGVPGRIDHITGLSTGVTYASMKAEALPEGFKVTADNNGFFDREPEALGLMRENLNQLIPQVREEVRQKTTEAILS